MADRFPIIIESNEQQIQELSAGDGLDLTKSGVVNANYVHSAGVNAGIVTATSFIGDGSQITNIPAGGGSLEATASGTLSDGSKVIVNTDGTVSVVAQTETTGGGVGDETVFETGESVYMQSAFVGSGKVVIVYRDNGNSFYGTAVVGTVSGTSISFGSPVVFNSANSANLSVTYDSANDKVVVAYTDYGNNGYGTAIVGTVSGTSISFGSAVVFESNSSQTNHIASTFDSTNNKVVIAYRAGSIYRGYGIVGTVSGTSISFGTAAVFESGRAEHPSATFDSTNNKVVIAYSDYGNNNYGTAVVGEVSGTSISFGSPVVFESAATNTSKSVVYDSSNQKVVIAYKDDGNSSYGTAIVGTVSGTSISFGSPVVFYAGMSVEVRATYDSTNNEVIITYIDSPASGTPTKAIVGTVSGTSISFGSAIVAKSDYALYGIPVYDSTNDKVVIAYGDSVNSNYGTAVVLSTTGVSIPQVGSPTVFESATIGETSAAFDSTNNKVVIAYKDSGNSFYGTAVVGEVSGTSITFGTPVVFESANSHEPSVTFDSSTGKIVIAYSDGGNSDYGTAIVGTVSGTSISFGSPAVFESAGTLQISSTFDSTNNKVVISYRDGGNNYYGTAIVGTVSGTSISFGSAAVFETSFTNITSATYDSSNQKVVIAYKDQGNNDYGTAVVGTVSGTSISFGSPVVFESARAELISAVYDSSNGKVVIAYNDYGNSENSTAIVGTVSGTSISFGSPVVFHTNADNLSATYDSTNGKVVIAYTDKDNSYNGTAIPGTVSGTSITFGSPTEVESGDTYDVASVYDSTNSKVVVAYRDHGNSGYGTAVVYSPTTLSTNLTAENFIGISNGAYSNGQTATIQIAGSVDDAQSSLTPGQQYYVQGDGTLSETADSPSVLAGTAVAATKLMIG